VNALQTLAQAAGIAYAAGLNLYATVGIVGLAARLGFIGPLPGVLTGVSSWWVIVVALLLDVVHFFVFVEVAGLQLYDALHHYAQNDREQGESNQHFNRGKTLLIT